MKMEFTLHYFPFGSHVRTLSPVKSVYVASAAAGSQVPMFEKIRALANSPHGIWLATAHSSLLQLWHDGQCEMLFDIRYDHSHRQVSHPFGTFLLNSFCRKPSFDELDDDLSQVEVCSILYHADELWVGTVDGNQKMEIETLYKRGFTVKFLFRLFDALSCAFGRRVHQRIVHVPSIWGRNHRRKWYNCSGQQISAGQTPVARLRTQPSGAVESPANLLHSNGE